MVGRKLVSNRIGADQFKEGKCLPNRVTRWERERERERSHGTAPRRSVDVILISTQWIISSVGACCSDNYEPREAPSSPGKRAQNDFENRDFERLSASSLSPFYIIRPSCCITVREVSPICPKRNPQHANVFQSKLVRRRPRAPHTNWKCSAGSAPRQWL